MVGQPEGMALRARHHIPHSYPQVVCAAAVTADLRNFSLWQGTHDPGVSFRFNLPRVTIEAHYTSKPVSSQFGEVLVQLARLTLPALLAEICTP